MTDTEMKWRERVGAWRTSGETAEVFAEKGGFEPTTLRYWASRLKLRKTSPTPASKLRPKTVTMARVGIRRRSGEADQHHDRDGSAAELVVAIGDARIVIGRNFDAALLRDVVAALGGAR